MRMALPFLAVLTVVPMGCRHHRGDAPPSALREGQDRDRSAAAPGCTVPDVENARPVALVELPRGCAFLEAGTAAAPRVIHDPTELAAAIRCEGVEPPVIDLSAHDVFVVGYAMSPAHGGRDTLDDGNVVTFVTRLRRNCPDDPMPMPMSVSYGFLMPKGATRTYREASCALPLDCP